MIELTVDAADLSALQATLLRGDTEYCAILYASRAISANGRVRLLGREIVVPSNEDYESRRVDHAQLKPEFMARVTKRARIEGLSIVFAHSHPGRSAPHFSVTDDEGERDLAEFLGRRMPGSVHGALVASEGGFRARELGTASEMRVVSLGDHRRVLFDPEHPPPLSPLFGLVNVNCRNSRVFRVATCSTSRAPLTDRWLSVL